MQKFFFSIRIFPHKIKLAQLEVYNTSMKFHQNPSYGEANGFTYTYRMPRTRYINLGIYSIIIEINNKDHWESHILAER
jgi:hypothetical protein